MPLVRYGLAAAAAACLLGGLAVANADAPAPMAGSTPPADQSASPPDQANPPPEQQGASAADQGAAAQSAPAAATSSADTSANVTASGTQVIASQPVPDTPANRAAYGQPMSRAGKHTAPTGD